MFLPLSEKFSRLIVETDEDAANYGAGAGNSARDAADDVANDANDAGAAGADELA